MQDAGRGYGMAQWPPYAYTIVFTHFVSTHCRVLRGYCAVRAASTFPRLLLCTAGVAASAVARQRGTVRCPARSVLGYWVGVRAFSTFPYS